MTLWHLVNSFLMANLLKCYSIPATEWCFSLHFHDNNSRFFWLNIPFLPLVCSVRFSTDSLSSSRVWKSRSTADNTKRVNALGGTWFRFSLRNFVDDCQKRRVHSKFIPNLWDNAGRERSTGKFLGICLIYDCTWCAESTVIIFCIFAFLQILDFCLTLLGR